MNISLCYRMMKERKISMKMTANRVTRRIRGSKQLWHQNQKSFRIVYGQLLKQGNDGLSACAKP
jgi:hypothetical protein